MDAALRARIARELPPGGWAPENHGKLADFLAKHAGAGVAGAGRCFAAFDADNTAWGGDLGDSVLVFMLRNLSLSPRLHEVLPDSLDVPPGSLGVPTGGRLFAAARVRTALAAMTAAYRRLVAPSASVADFLGAFSEALLLPGGPLHGDAAFTGAYRVYVGTVMAVFNLLEASVGCLAFDADDARVVTPLFSDAMREFYGRERRAHPELASFSRPGSPGDLVFPTILDTGPDQRALAARGRLGAYSQITVWESLDQTPDTLRRLALQVWEASPPLDTRYEAVFPVDAPDATAPAPLDFGAGLSAGFVRGGRRAEGIVLGAAAMLHGTRLRPDIANLMAAMMRHDIVPVVVTASQEDLVRAVLERHYGFGGHPVVGMRTVLEGGVYGADLTAPATYRSGKVEAIRAVARAVAGSEEARPVLCAGDTNTDLEMLAYSGAYREFFDRGKRPLMDLARDLAARGEAARTVVQVPFEG